MVLRQLQCKFSTDIDSSLNFMFQPSSFFSMRDCSSFTIFSSAKFSLVLSHPNLVTTPIYAGPSTSTRIIHYEINYKPTEDITECLLRVHISDKRAAILTFHIYFSRRQVMETYIFRVSLGESHRANVRHKVPRPWFAAYGRDIIPG
jgi:hypothetical protein